MDLSGTNANQQEQGFETKSAQMNVELLDEKNGAHVIVNTY